jgi:hypothetical protein
MDTKRRRRLAAAAMAGVGAIHIALVPEYASEQAYIGVLFAVGGIAATLVAAKLWVADHTPSWALGALIAAGMATGFVLSRTIGLPGFKEAEWEPSGILSLLLEGGFLALAGGMLGRRSLAREPQSA